MQPTHRGVPARLARINPTGAFLAALALMLVGLLSPGIIGGGILLVLAAALVALLVLTWPIQPAPTRVLRLAVVTLLLAAALLKIL
ncbi:DUF6703 family protein [Polymorphospora sp. NPDC050346]|uniref:DUF6703 family protein n=1 Tax=Polymorphospora sp. NPDC050346 TaxID=3155780 RepID=UPI0033F1AF28